MTIEEQIKIKDIRELGFGMQEAVSALLKFNWDVTKALYYLQIRGDAVCRRKPNGRMWTEQDYIDYVNSFEF
jgi:hypothetical protein